MSRFRYVSRHWYYLILYFIGGSFHALQEFHVLLDVALARF